MFGLQGLDGLTEQGLELLRGGGVEHLPLPRHAAGGPEQAQQVAAQHPQRLGATAPLRAFEPGVIALGIHGDDTPQGFQQPLALVFPQQLGGCGLAPGQPGGAALDRQRLFHPARPEQLAGHGGADDPQADFRTARHCLVEHLQGRCGGGQGDDGSGVARQYETVGCVVAQQRGAGGTEGQPQGHGQQEQQGRLAQGSDQQYRHRGPHQGAQQAVGALGQDHAAAGLADDEHCGQGPLRLFEIQAERQVQGQAAGNQAARGEQQVGRGRGEEGLPDIGAEKGRQFHLSDISIAS